MKQREQWQRLRLCNAERIGSDWMKLSTAGGLLILIILKIFCKDYYNSAFLATFATTLNVFRFS